MSFNNLFFILREANRKKIYLFQIDAIIEIIETVIEKFSFTQYLKFPYLCIDYNFKCQVNYIILH